eukprot:s3007_g8.t1
MFESESAFSQQLVLCSQPRRAWAVQVSAQQPVKNTAFEIHHACQRQGLARPQPGAADGIEDTAGKRDSQLPRRAHMVELALLRASQAPASLLPGRSAVPIGATWQGRGDAELHTATLRCTMNMTRDAFEILRVLHEPAHVPQAGPGAPRPARTECWTWPKAPGRVVSRSGMLGPWSSWAARLCGTPSGVWRQTCWREIAMRTRRRTITVSKGAARVAPSRHGLLGRIRLGEPFLWPRRSGDAGAGLARASILKGHPQADRAIWDHLGQASPAVVEFFFHALLATVTRAFPVHSQATERLRELGPRCEAAGSRGIQPSLLLEDLMHSRLAGSRGDCVERELERCYGDDATPAGDVSCTHSRADGSAGSGVGTLKGSPERVTGLTEEADCIFNIATVICPNVRACPSVKLTACRRCHGVAFRLECGHVTLPRRPVLRSFWAKACATCFAVPWSRAIGVGHGANFAQGKGAAQLGKQCAGNRAEDAG